MDTKNVKSVEKNSWSGKILILNEDSQTYSAMLKPLFFLKKGTQLRAVGEYNKENYIECTIISGPHAGHTLKFHREDVKLPNWFQRILGRL